MTGVKIKIVLVLTLNEFKALTVTSETLRMLDNKFVTVVDLVNEKIALLLVCLFELTQLLHHILSM